MSSFEDHCWESTQLFGKPHAEVHQWLDEFAGSSQCGYRHRRVRHHEEGIRRAVQYFGIEAGKVARQHIIADLKEEGWTEKDRFPQNEADFIRIGFF
ncbi:MAG: hypothetical protein WCJ37_13535 [Syntrophus sp. (in: bacteria)]